jgi:hypothetical protein
MANFMRPSWRKCARAWWIFALLFSATCAFGQGSKLNSEFEPVQERDQDNPKAREAWFMRGRTMPTGEVPAALRFRAFQQKMQLRQQFAARAVTAIPRVSTAAWSGAAGFRCGHGAELRIGFRTSDGGCD